MSLYDCLAGLEELLEELCGAGLSEVAFRSSRGSLVLRGEAAAGRGAAGAEEGKGAASPARLVLLRSHCVGRWSPAAEAAGVVERGARLGTVSTLLGEEGVEAPGPGRVERWIIGEGEVAGYGDPLALFREVS